VPSAVPLYLFQNGYGANAISWLNKQLASLQCEALFAFCAARQRLPLALWKKDVAPVLIEASVLVPTEAKRNVRITQGRLR